MGRLLCGPTAVESNDLSGVEVSGAVNKQTPQPACTDQTTRKAEPPAHKQTPQPAWTDQTTRKAEPPAHKQTPPTGLDRPNDAESKVE